jgi:hypothetical protein
VQPTFPVPEAPLPILSPLLPVVPGQLFAGALAHVKGLDADYPVGLSKVTPRADPLTDTASLNRVSSLGGRPRAAI